MKFILTWDYQLSRDTQYFTGLSTVHNTNADANAQILSSSPALVRCGSAITVKPSTLLSTFCILFFFFPPLPPPAAAAVAAWFDVEWLLALLLGWLCFCCWCCWSWRAAACWRANSGLRAGAGPHRPSYYVQQPHILHCVPIKSSPLEHHQQLH